MPLLMQTKLLRFLENRRFMRVGGTSKIQADVQLVFATLRPLEKEVQAGCFREDLYYRIQGVTVKGPGRPMLSGLRPFGIMARPLP